jgi:hypothetical protein
MRLNPLQGTQEKEQKMGATHFSGPIVITGQGGADGAALLFGGGSTASPVTTSEASKNFLDFRAKNTAASGDNRLAYFRFDLDGAGASGESLRAFTDLGAAAANARGAHISLQAGATGYISGLGAGVDAQLYVKNEVLAGGTYAAVNAEIYSEGTTTAVSAVTELAFIRCVAGGNATGIGRVDDKAYLLSIRGVAVGAGNMVVASASEANYSHAARCYLEGVGDVWMMFASASG